jgi:DNA polymerase-3 subunit epsilon
LNLAATPLAFIDLETTGTVATQDRITEIAIITWDGEQSTSWSALIDPQASIPAFVEQLTGITNDMVRGQPVFADLAHEIAARLNGHMLVAHNARFDYGFLKNEFKRCEIPFRAPVLCTLKLSRKLFPQHFKHNLDAIIERHQLDAGDRHRAMSDTSVLFQLWRQLEQQFSTEHLHAVVKELTTRSACRRIWARRLSISYRKPMACICSTAKTGCYIGKSNQLRQRVLSHFSADHAINKEMQLSQQVRDIEWIGCAGEVDALITEARLVKEKQPTLNRQLRRNTEFCSWQLAADEDGYLRPQLVYARDLQPGKQDELFGLFKSGASAKEFLLKAAKEYQLCNAILGLEKLPAGKPCFSFQLKQCRGACCAAKTGAA